MAYVLANPLSSRDPFGKRTEGDCCARPAPGQPNAYDIQPVGIAHGSPGGASPSTIEGLFGSFTALSQLQVFFEVIELGASGLTAEGMGILEQMLQGYIEDTAIGSSDPTGMLTGAAEEMLLDLAADVEANKGFTLWVQVEYLTCRETWSGWFNPFDCCRQWVTETNETKCRRLGASETGALNNTYVFGGNNYPDPTFADIQQCLSDAREEVVEEETVQ